MMIPGIWLIVCAGAELFYAVLAVSNGDVLTSDLSWFSVFVISWAIAAVSLNFKSS